MQIELREKELAAEAEQRAAQAEQRVVDVEQRAADAEQRELRKAELIMQKEKKWNSRNVWRVTN